MATEPPITQYVEPDLLAMQRDPAPYFSAMRAEPGWAWSPQLRMWLVTRYDDVAFVDSDPQLFSADVPGALLTRALGLTMVRTEGVFHRRLRSAGDAPLKRRAVSRDWRPVIDGIVDGQLDLLRGRPSFDLVADFAAPVVGACLRQVLGLRDATSSDIHRWSDTYIEALTNNADDPQVWRRAEAAAAEEEECVAGVLGRVRAEPDGTVVSALANAHPEDPLSLAEISANLRVMIAGGFNDARDVVATAPWLLMTHPDAMARALSDAVALGRSIEESIRWLSPVGSFPRVVTEDVVLPGIKLKAGDQVLVVIASANWDESRFPDPHSFNIDRANLDDHFGFSAGAHFCIASHLVRGIVASAIPALLETAGIRPAADPTFVGWQFRGPVSISVTAAPRLDDAGPS